MNKRTWKRMETAEQADVLLIGQRVRFKPGDMADYAKRRGGNEGEVVPQPLWSVGVPPPGGVYVLWKGLHEPAPAFVEDLEPLPSPLRQRRRK